jgi:hypothetical protein
MPRAGQSTPTVVDTAEEERQQKPNITPELVRKIADKVYGMLLSDLRIENERIQPSPQRQRNARGGW